MADTKLTARQRELLKRRGMNPADYVVVKDLYGSLWLRNIRTGKIRIINRNN